LARCGQFRQSRSVTRLLVTGSGYSLTGNVAIGTPNSSASVLRLVPSSSEAGSGSSTSSRTLDDHALVSAARAGDRAVASSLCNRLWPQVDRTIRKLLGRRDTDHEDLAQLALFELVRTIDRYRGDCSLDTWAQTVTAHVVFKYIRRRRTERRIFADALGDDEAPAAPIAMDKRSLSRDILARVSKHLEKMNEGRAWTFVMHELMGYELKEIAEMTQVSLAAAQSRLVRGRRDLHKRIAADPELAEMLKQREGGG
jgi:RNA polymerase sigma-70 factor (ECF subfamily)